MTNLHLDLGSIHKPKHPISILTSLRLLALGTQTGNCSVPLDGRLKLRWGNHSALQSQTGDPTLIQLFWVQHVLNHVQIVIQA